MPEKNSDTTQERFTDDTIRRVAERVWQLWREELRREQERRSKPAGRT
jgi:hypothetical protein